MRNFIKVNITDSKYIYITVTGYSENNGIPDPLKISVTFQINLLRKFSIPRDSILLFLERKILLPSFTVNCIFLFCVGIRLYRIYCQK